MKQISEKEFYNIRENGYEIQEGYPAYYKGSEERVSTIYHIRYNQEIYILADIYKEIEDHSRFAPPVSEYFIISEQEVEKDFKKTTWSELLDPQPLREALEILKSIKEDD